MVAPVAVALLTWVATSAARAAPHCTELVDRTNVVSCALHASLSVRAEEHGLQSVEARGKTASVLLPSNPTLSVTGAYPVEPALDRRPMLWSATLSQELQIGGQRGARLRMASAEAQAQRSRLVAARREVAARALLAYFDSIAAAELIKIAGQLSVLADALKQVAAERALAGVGSDLDASLADAAAVRIAQLQSAAEERMVIATVALSSLLGISTSTKPRVEGDLVPLAVVDSTSKELLDGAMSRRTELGVVLAERELYEGRVDLYRRQRIPNPTISVFGRSDWIGERSIGIGLGFPIPLPAPLGQSYAGEIAESAALSSRASAEADAVRRTIALELATSLAKVDASRRRVALYTSERLNKTQRALTTIAEELTAGRLPPREALLAQQGLMDVLSGYIEARHALCHASVALAVAAGLSLEQGIQ